MALEYIPHHRLQDATGRDGLFTWYLLVQATSSIPDKKLEIDSI
jgi:hypothetical protein